MIVSVLLFVLELVLAVVDGAVDVPELSVHFFTVILQVQVFLPHLAVMVAVPAFFAVTLPFLFTVATLLLLELQVTEPEPPFTRRVEQLPFSKHNFALVNLQEAAPDTVPAERENARLKIRQIDIIHLRFLLFDMYIKSLLFVFG